MKLDHNNWILVVLTSILIVILVLSILYFHVNTQEIPTDVTTIHSTEMEDNTRLFVADQDPYLIITGEYPPYVTSDVTNRGSYYQIVEAVLNEMGIEYRIEFYPWNRGLSMVESGKGFSSFPYMPTPERREKFLFTDPLNQEGVDAFVMYYYEPNNDFSFMDNHGIDSFSTFKIGGLTNYFYVSDFKSANIKLDMSDNEIDVFMKLKAGRIDFVPSDMYVAKYLIEAFYPDEVDNFKFVRIQFNSVLEQYRLILSCQNKEAQNFIDSFNVELRKLKSSGFYEKLYENHQ